MVERPTVFVYRADRTLAPRPIPHDRVEVISGWAIGYSNAGSIDRHRRVAAYPESAVAFVAWPEP